MYSGWRGRLGHLSPENLVCGEWGEEYGLVFLVFPLFFAFVLVGRGRSFYCPFLLLRL